MKGGAETHPCARVPRIDGDRATIHLSGFRQPAFGFVCSAEIQEQFHVSRGP
jgi:hypothetical protein